jgi:hypothetical protein
MNTICSAQGGKYKWSRRSIAVFLRKTITKSLHSPAFSCGGSGAVAEVVMVKQVEEDWLRLA